MDIKMRKMDSSSNFKSPGFFTRRKLDRLWATSGYSLKRVLVSVFILSLATAAYFFVFHKKQADPSVALQNETNELTARIGKFMDLPAAEQPTLVTVTDKAKLRGQDFFQHAQDGDKLLVYAKAKKAILYRPSTGKIIDVTNLTTGDGSNG